MAVADGCFTQYSSNAWISCSLNLQIHHDSRVEVLSFPRCILSQIPIWPDLVHSSGDMIDDRSVASEEVSGAGVVPATSCFPTHSQSWNLEGPEDGLQVREPSYNMEHDQSSSPKQEVKTIENSRITCV